MRQTLIFVFSLLLLTATSVTGFGAEAASKYGPAAEPFSMGTHREYFKRGAGPDYFRMLPFYVGQDNALACSLAALTTFLNSVQAMGLKKKVNPVTKNFTLMEMRKTILDEDYVIRMSGDPKIALLKKGHLGIAISEFRDVVERTLKKADLSVITPEVKLVAFKSTEGNHRKAEKARLLSDLKKNEKSDDDFIILNFVQGVLTGDPEGMLGHVAVVAAYDEKTEGVLILDPDREFYEPYWSPADKVFEAIVHPKADRIAPGYLVVKVK